MNLSLALTAGTALLGLLLGAWTHRYARETSRPLDGNPVDGSLLNDNLFNDKHFNDSRVDSSLARTGLETEEGVPAPIPLTARPAVRPAASPGVTPAVIPAVTTAVTTAIPLPAARPPWWQLVLPATGAGALVWLLPAQSFWVLSQGLLLFALLYLLTLVDAASLTVDLPVVFAGLVLRLAGLALLHPLLLVEMVGGLLAGAGLLTLVGLFYHWLRGRRGLGEGDAAVLGLIGAFVGWEGIFAVVFLASATGILIGGGWLLFSRRPANTPLPLVPFLALGGMGVYLAQGHGWGAAHLLSLWSLGG